MNRSLDSYIQAKCWYREKQTLFYFAIVLDCNVAVLDAVFWTSLATLWVKPEDQKQMLYDVERWFRRELTRLLNIEDHLEINGWSATAGKYDWWLQSNLIDRRNELLIRIWSNDTCCYVDARCIRFVDGKLAVRSDFETMPQPWQPIESFLRWHLVSLISRHKRS